MTREVAALTLHCTAALAVFALFAVQSAAQPAEVPLSDRELEIRARYLELLGDNPYQIHAFDRAYASFQENEGVASWIEVLEGDSGDVSNHVLLGRVFAKQLATAKAIRHLERARELGAEGARLNALLGHVYADAGRYADAVPLLDAAIESLADEDVRTAAIRRLGDVHNRLGNRDEAISAWQRLTERANADAFAHWELAAVYEDHRLWDQAANAYAAIAAQSRDDPYTRCRALRAQAIANVRRNQISEAIALFEEAMGLASPGNWLFNDLTQQLIAAYEGLGDLDGLAGYIRARVDEDPASIEYRVLLAQVYTRQRDNARAEPEYRAVLERAPDHVPAHLALGDLLEDAGRIDDAAEVLASLAARFPRDTDYIRRIGELYWNAGEESKAVTEWRRVLDVSEDPEHHARLAGWLASHELAEAAIAELEQAVAVKKERAWLFDLAELYAVSGDIDAARQTWQSTLTDSSTALEVTEVARLLETNDFVDEAEVLYARAIEIDPTLHDARHALAGLLSRGERVDEAVPHYEILATANDSEYWRSRGERGLLKAFDSLGITGKKQREWEQAVEQQPKSIDRRLRLARLYQSRGHHLGAVEQYRACAELAPEELAHREALAEAYERAGRYARAAETYESLIEDQPSRARGYFRGLVDVYQRINDRAATERAAERVVEFAPTDPDARVLLAHVYLRHRRDDDAFQQFRDAIRLDPSQSSFHLQYGEALIDRQRFVEARDAYRRLLEATEDPGIRRDCLGRLASIHSRLNSIEDLTREFEAHIRATPNRLDAYADLAAIHAGAERPAEALAVLERAHERMPQSEEVLKLLLNAAFDANDLRKTIEYTEARIALSGKPDAQELVRLGRAYADTGDMDAALATWARIRDEHPNDATAIAAEAKALYAHGYFDESFERTRAALEIDPSNSSLRAEFAQHLAEHSELDEAFDQFFLVLDFGESVAANSSTNRKRSYANYRQMAVQQMVQLAQAFGRTNDVLARLERSQRANKQSQTARNVLMFAYERLQRVGDAIALAEEALESQPEDTALIQKLANMYMRTNRNADAAELFMRLAEIEPSRARDIQLRASLMFQQSEEHRDRALEIVKALHEADRSDVQAALRLAMLQASLGNHAEAEHMYARLLDSESEFWRDESVHTDQAVRMRNMVEQNWASYLEANERTDEARRLYEAMLVRDDPSAATVQPHVYRVTGHGSALGIMPDLRNAVQRLFPSAGYVRANAAAKLHEIAPDQDSALKRAVADAEKHSDATRTALEKIYITALIVEGDDGPATQRIEALLQDNAEDVELYNALLYVHERQFDYGEALQVYERVKTAMPHLRNQVEQAELALAMQEGDFKLAGRVLRAQLDSGNAPSAIVNQLHQLYNLGGARAAEPLIELVLERDSASIDALMLASRIRSDRGDFDAATEYAERAWEAAGGVTGKRSRQIFHMLHGLYANAGQSEVFVELLREAAEKRPRSLQHRKQLAEIYNMTGEREKAIEQYEAIRDMRPRDIETMRTLANLYASVNRTDAAIELHSKMLAMQPGLYRQIGNQLAQLYKQSGRIEELAAFEEQLVMRETNARDVIALARRALQRDDADRAIAFFERALALEPENVYAQLEMARAYIEHNDYKGAYKAVEAMLESARRNDGVHLQFRELQLAATVYKRMVATPELEAIADAFGETANGQRTQSLLLAAIAHHEKRYEDAFNILTEVDTKRGHLQHIATMIEIAKAAGHPEWAVAPLEKAAESDRHGNFSEQLAQLHMDLGNKEKAVEAIKRQVKQAAYPHIYSNALRWMMRYEMYDYAEAFYEENERILRRPQLAQQVDREIVQAYIAAGVFEEIVTHSIVRPDNPRLASILQSLSGARHESGQRALKLMKNASEKFPDDAAILRTLANMHTKAERFDDALSLWKRIIELQPDNVNDRRNYGGLLQRLNRRDEAATMLKEWAAAKPSLNRLRLALGYLNPGEDPGGYLAWRDGFIAKLDADDRDAARALFKPLDVKVPDSSAVVESRR